MAAVNAAPAATAVHELDPICTGEDLETVVPSPNAPLVPAPHVNKVPPERMAAV
jgi:hypothetical protein